jgi:hypothetical protein
MYPNGTESGLNGDRKTFEIPEEYQYAIVLVQEMDYDMVKRSPAVEADTDLVYATIGFTACSLATYISEIGYRAIPSVNELGIDIAFAVDAGLGILPAANSINPSFLNCEKAIGGAGEKAGRRDGIAVSACGKPSCGDRF